MHGLMLYCLRDYFITLCFDIITNILLVCIHSNVIYFDLEDLLCVVYDFECATCSAQLINNIIHIPQEASFCHLLIHLSLNKLNYNVSTILLVGYY